MTLAVHITAARWRFIAEEAVVCDVNDSDILKLVVTLDETAHDSSCK